MRFIKDKMDYVNSDIGFLTATEFNSIKTELANVVKYRNVLNDNDDKQLLKAIITEAKILFYKDSGTSNHIVLSRNNEDTTPLVDAQTFIFKPAYTNTGITNIKINNGVEKVVKLNGEDLAANFLDVKVTYMAVYDIMNDWFEIMNLTIGTQSDFVFSNMHNEATFVEVDANDIGTNVNNNDLVYIDQNTGKYELAKIENPKTQKQNVIAIFKNVNDKNYVFYSGIVPDFRAGLISGFKYYLSKTTFGGITTEVNDVYIGRYLKDGKFLLDISGDVGLAADYIGVKEFMNNIINGQTANGVIFTDVSNLFTLMYDTVSFNPATTKKLMYVRINTYDFRIDFAPEYTDNEFNIEYNDIRYVGVFKEAGNINNPIELYEFGQIVIDNTEPVLSSTDKTFNTTLNVPLTLETVTASDNKDGNLTVVKVGTPDFTVAGTYLVTYTATDSSGNSKTITHTYNVSAIITFDNNLVNPQSVNGITLTDPSNTMTFMFNTVIYDPTTPATVMFFKANNVTAKVDYATEYNGRAFEIEIDTIRYAGVFGENENYGNPTVINVK